MSAKRFIDTNVLIYAFAKGDPRTPTAEKILTEGGAFSVQVLNEFARVSHHKLGVDWNEIARRLKLVRSLLDPPAPLTEQLHDAARDIARSRKIAFYDALTVAAALAVNCEELLTEDLQAGAKFSALTVRNPFATP